MKCVPGQADCICIIWHSILCQVSGSRLEQELTVAVMQQGQHQMAPTFVGDSIHQTDDEKASEAMTGGSLLGGPGMTEMPGLQAALAAASAAMQAAGQSMPPPAPITQHHHHSLSQVCSATLCIALSCWPP